jgi:hypothetical protein
MDLEAKKAMLTEVHLVSDAYDFLMATQTIAEDDKDYDLFAAGWKAAVDACLGVSGDAN